MGQLKALAVLGVLALAACKPAPKACLADLPIADPAHRTAGMVRLAGGDFLMGAAPLRPEEGPPQAVKVAPFWIDRTEVTNAAFARFVEATGYRTVAERPLDPARYAQLTAAQRRPASLVFVGAKAARSDDPSQWWQVVPGADWRHPAGPGSNIRGKDAWPVVHIAWADAMAYARWLGRDLPTEAEWEYAARGGLVGKRYAWGDQPQDEAHPKANTWQGPFPAEDLGTDGYKASPAPVGCYPPNGFGLVDMAGNVWEWTKDWFRPGLEAPEVVETGGPPQARALDPDEPNTPKHVVKGGSFLCTDDFCFRYRPAARTPGPPDTGASHVGFRTVLRD
ncbi:formylglycine-generating enzyme family protein [Caulobacter sp.]|uniref:formylglycine-generating enzyme family protein n=1 Tax=Caulobacter sp. TaxID=78 RepID=UPI001B124BBE|nr:formylglycine-generating enzyme family protein [Caulobacter sp.]MBO9544768.1 formylglycine-generating enzyme family protein [Caulobacter sp.]